MACRSCGGGGGGKAGSVRISVPDGAFAQAAPSPAPDPSADMILLEYIGVPTQFRTLRSRVVPGRMYEYGGEVGSQDRFFYIYKGDADWLLQYVNEFKVADKQRTAGPQLIVESNQQPTTPIAPPVLSADADFSAPIETLDVDPEILGVLKGAGYTSVDQVARASDVELASIKGMGPARRKKVANALAALV